MTREDYVKALRAERAYAETLTDELGRERRLADIDAELAKFDPQPQASARGRGRPETA